MAGDLLLAAETYIWSLQGICRLHRIPFASNLVLQQFPPPYDLLTLQQATTALGLKSGLLDAGSDDLHELPVPFIAVLQPASLSDDSNAGGSAQTHGLAIVFKCSDDRISYFEQGKRHPVIVPAKEFERQFAGRVMLCVPAAPELKAEDGAGDHSGKFGFSWFVPALLRHKSIWRDVLLASLVIQLMALATESCARSW